MTPQQRNSEKVKEENSRRHKHLAWFDGAPGKDTRVLRMRNKSTRSRVLLMSKKQRRFIIYELASMAHRQRLEFLHSELTRLKSYQKDRLRHNVQKNAAISSILAKIAREEWLRRGEQIAYKKGERERPAPQLLAALFDVDVSVIYRVLTRYVKTGDILFKGDLDRKAEAGTCRTTLTAGQKRDYGRSKSHKKKNKMPCQDQYLEDVPPTNYKEKNNTNRKQPQNRSKYAFAPPRRRVLTSSSYIKKNIENVFPGIEQEMKDKLKKVLSHDLFN